MGGQKPEKTKKTYMHRYSCPCISRQTVTTHQNSVKMLDYYTERCHLLSYKCDLS